MIELRNSELVVSILDPVADRERLGSRYCTGGFIWQVTDLIKGPLLSGPKYPNPTPSPFDGQGLPEVFEIALGQDKVKMGEEVCVIGVGKVKRTSPVKPFHVRNNFEVTQFTDWIISKSPENCSMVSRQKFLDYDFVLNRQIILRDRKLISTTIFENKGKMGVPLRWFAHPFFPHHGFDVARFSLECEIPSFLPSLGGFLMNVEGTLVRSDQYPWNNGCYQFLNLPFGSDLTLFQKHPLLGEVTITCNFPLAAMPVWANENTVSLEPYLHTIVNPENSFSWSMSYQF